MSFPHSYNRSFRFLWPGFLFKKSIFQSATGFFNLLHSRNQKTKLFLLAFQTLKQLLQLLLIFASQRPVIIGNPLQALTQIFLSAQIMFFCTGFQCLYHIAVNATNTDIHFCFLSLLPFFAPRVRFGHDSGETFFTALRSKLRVFIFHPISVWKMKRA